MNTITNRVRYSDHLDSVEVNKVRRAWKDELRLFKPWLKTENMKLFRLNTYWIAYSCKDDTAYLGSFFNCLKKVLFPEKY